MKEKELEAQKKLRIETLKWMKRCGMLNKAALKELKELEKEQLEEKGKTIG